MKVLVTGGSGFIGINLIKYFLQRKDIELLNIDIKLSPLVEINNITEICDICDKHKLLTIISKFNPDYIVHLAARTDLDGKTLEDYSANTIGVRNLVEIALTLPNLKKILITSSMLVCKAGYQPVSQEDYCPTTLYGQSKVLTEQITRKADLKCDWVFLRPTSIWGPWFNVPYRNFFDMIKARRYFHIGHNSCTKTYGFVGNAVYQIIAILFSDTTDNPNKVYYLGDEPTNIEEWANEIATFESIHIPRLPFVIFRFAALFGDLLKFIGIKFPMTSFRLHNMTTDNIINLSNTDLIAPLRPYSRIEGIEQTLDWLKK